MFAKKNLNIILPQQDALGLKSPKWVLDNLSLLKELNDETFVVDFITEEMAQLTSGLFSKFNK